MKNKCLHAVHFRVMRANDDLFSPLALADSCYVLTKGKLIYTQFPNSSPVREEVRTDVDLGQWICEASMWCKWKHVGKVEAECNSQLVEIRAEEFLADLKQAP